VEVFAAQTEQGPCWDCVHTGVAVTSADLATATDRWPRFTTIAVNAGFQAACAVPMRLREDVIGALTLLNTGPVAISESSIALGQALADVATIGILQQRAVRHDEILAEQLQAALHHRTVIEQAKGVLAEVGGLDMNQAYLVLRGYARAHRRRLSDVAYDVATTTVDPHVLLADPAAVSRP
jgi:GAF domain-containing protein